MGHIFKVGTDPQVFAVQKAKTVSGRFGVQLWMGATDSDGVEGAVYLPWANVEGDMSGVVQQFIRTGLIGPEDFSPNADVFYDQFKDQTFRIVKVFKDQKQFINVDLVGAPSPLKAAAIKELSLEEQAKLDDAEFFGKLAGQQQPKAPAAAQQPTSKVVKPRESANDRYARAFAHVMETYAAQMAELDPALAQVLVAQTATLFIAYEKEG